MPELHVRDIPAELHDRLRQQARAEGRSMSAEVVAILRNALEAGHRIARRNTAIEQLRAISARTRLPSGAPAADELVREDRDDTRVPRPRRRRPGSRS